MENCFLTNLSSLLISSKSLFIQILFIGCEISNVKDLHGGNMLDLLLSHLIRLSILVLISHELLKEL